MKALSTIVLLASLTTGAAQAAPMFSSEPPVGLPQAQPLGYASKGLLRQRPAPKPRQTPAKVKPAAAAALPSNLALLKPVDFPKLRDSLKGKVLVVNFWATWCAPCVAEMPEFVKLEQEYAGKGAQVIAISADDSTDLKTLVASFVKEKQMKFPVYVMDTDDPQEMMNHFNKDWPGTLPATFVFNKQGQIILTKYGIINRDELVQAIEQALK